MSDVIGPATISVGQGFAVFQFFMPKFSDVRKASITQDPDLAGDVRFGEVASSIICVGIGAVLSSITGSPIPTYAALVVAVGLVVVYETALRGEKIGNPVASMLRSEVV